MHQIDNNFLFEEETGTLYPVIDIDPDVQKSDVIVDPSENRWIDWDSANEKFNKKENRFGLDSLPSFYGRHQFENDSLQMFTPKTGDFSVITEDVKNVAPLNEQCRLPQIWAANPRQERLNELEEIDAKAIYQFFEEFPETQGYKDLLEATEFDSELSTYYFLKLLELEEAEHPNISINSLLKRFLRSAKLGFPLFKYMVFGDQPGDHHSSLHLLNRVKKTQEILRQISFKFEYIGHQNQKRKPTFVPHDDVEPRKIRSWGEPIITSDLMLPDDIFYHRLIGNDLTTLQHFKYEKVPKTYVMLVDISGSMDNGQGRIEYACASAISLVENALRSANRGIVILFDGCPHRPMEFKSVQDVVKYFMQVPFSGGGTSIDRALINAETFNPNEIILITDGFDTVNYIPKTPLYTIFCQPEPNEDLEKISCKYENYQLGAKI